MRALQEIADRDVSWDVDGIEVRATMTLPVENKRCGAVVLVAGSGPTDRDWNTPLLPGNNGSGKLLAESLAQAGYVTIRYDKRASGRYAQENATRLIGKVSMQSHVEELSGAVAALVSSREVDTHRIFTLTNSEGAVHALNYQHQASFPRFAGLVMTGVPGRSMLDVMRSQVVPQLQGLPNANELIQQYDAGVAAIAAGEPLKIDKSLPDVLRTLLAALSNPAKLPFSRQLLQVNPAQLLHEVDEPALIVIGKKDIQVDWKSDGAALEAALADRTNVTFAYPECANHVLKYEPRPREQLQPAEAAAGYNSEESTLDSDALEVIQTWLAAQTESSSDEEQA